MSGYIIICGVIACVCTENEYSTFNTFFRLRAIFDTTPLRIIKCADLQAARTAFTNNYNEGLYPAFDRYNLCVTPYWDARPHRDPCILFEGPSEIMYSIDIAATVDYFHLDPILKQYVVCFGYPHYKYHLQLKPECPIYVPGELTRGNAVHCILVREIAITLESMNMDFKQIL